MKIELWIQGFNITGNSAKASLLSTEEAPNFESAIKKYEVSEDTILDYYNNHYSIWGCKIFDNEMDARKAFG